ncbi:MAG: hypothetical protein P1P89_09900 [Desulfobacterales bacterium]|nr:hypothetical protein [Desulfobacterales bacterium]
MQQLFLKKWFFPNAPGERVPGFESSGVQATVINYFFKAFDTLSPSPILRRASLAGRILQGGKTEAVSKPSQGFETASLVKPLN